MRSIGTLWLFAAAGVASLGGGCAGGESADTSGTSLTTPTLSVPACTNLECKQVACPATSPTMLKGTVVVPNGMDPVYNAIVYVPNSEVLPFVQGVSCDRCGTVSGTPIASAITAPDGTFELQNVPVGQDIPLVVQIGRWRRQVKIPSVLPCITTNLTTEFTHLPGTQADGDIPLHAISTGQADGMECVLLKMGIDQSEFTIPGGGGRIHLYADNGATLPNAPPASALTADAATLQQYDFVAFDCEGSAIDKAVADQQRVVDYASAGGRVFASHFSYTWLYNIAPFSGTAQWTPNSTGSDVSSVSGTIDTSFPKGQAFAAWLQNLGDLTGVDQIEIDEPRFDAASVVAPAQRWIYTEAPSSLEHYTFNTPVGVDEADQCGRVSFSDFHVAAFAYTAAGLTFPQECGLGEALTPQEQVLEFMILDLLSCIQGDSIPPAPPLQVAARSAKPRSGLRQRVVLSRKPDAHQGTGFRLHPVRRRVGAAELHARRAVLGLQDLELDAAVLRPRGLVVPRIDGAVEAIALAAQPVLRDAALHERRHHRVHARLRELEVVLLGAALVGVPGDLDEREVLVLLQRLGDDVDDLERHGRSPTTRSRT